MAATRSSVATSPLPVSTEARAASAAATSCWTSSTASTRWFEASGVSGPSWADTSPSPSAAASARAGIRLPNELPTSLAWRMVAPVAAARSLPSSRLSLHWSATTGNATEATTTAAPIPNNVTCSSCSPLWSNGPTESTSCFRYSFTSDGCSCGKYEAFSRR